MTIDNSNTAPASAVPTAAVSGWPEILDDYANARVAAQPGGLVTVLYIGSEYCWVAHGNDRDASLLARLEIGAGRVARERFKRNPPSLAELEEAIEVIENQVMPLAKQLATGSELFTSNESIASMLQTGADEPKAAATFSLDAVEGIFGRLVAISAGRPRIQASLPSDNATMATVLILREFLHHLQFERISIQISTDA